MDIQVILKILYFVLLLVLGGATLYYKTNDKLRSKVATLIAKAEYEYKDVVKAGGKKKAWVVSRLYDYIPVFIKPFISEEALSAFVQYVFDYVEMYAKLQLDKLVNKAIDEGNSK